MKRDQKFFDMYSLVIGALAIFTLGIFVLAMKMNQLTQRVFTIDTAEYQAEIRQRMEPFGQVYMPGDDLAAADESAAAATPQPVETTLTGPQVFNEACIACHGTGIGGAPAVSDAGAWASRLEQGIETLERHAIEGFTGSAGYMPPKGGRLDLSDQEIRDAVEYMVSQAQQ